jgi:hypothetical protein
MVLFRSTTVAGAFDILKGMIGLNGISLPSTIYKHFGPLAGWFQGIGLTQQSWGGHDFLVLAALIPPLVFIALACPNTLQLMARFEPALGVRQRPGEYGPVMRVFEWTPSLAWSVGMCAIAVAGILSLGGPSEFLYWQF